MKTRFTTSCRNFRAGLSLIEVLAALTMTLIVLVAMMQAFKFANNEMTKGRASVELTNQLRTVEDLLRSDLSNLTVDVRSHYDAAAEPKGYFEIVDGRATDVNFVAVEIGAAVATPAHINTSIQNMVMGDYDDVISGTVRSPGAPFRGRHQGTIQESLFAEVVWFTVANDQNADAFIDASERVRLYRRVLIVNPILGEVLPGDGTALSFVDAQTARNTYLRNNDISVRVAPHPTTAGFIVTANSLESLAIRNNRFFTAVNGRAAGANFNARYSNYRTNFQPQGVVLPNGSVNTVSRMLIDQQDLLLNDVTAFDVRVFDPSEVVGSLTGGGGVPVGGRTPIALPSLNGIDTIVANFATPQNYSGETGFTTFNLGGAYVDLGKGTVSGTLGLAPTGFPAIGTRLNFVDVYYDTGTPAYEHNNIDDDGDASVDEGADSLDDDADGLIDELDEKEVPSPYSVALRGISVSVRMVEPITNQVSQMTIKKSLVAE